MVPINEYVGDIFEAPHGSVLIHACNCRGAWGSGFAMIIDTKVQSNSTSPLGIHPLYLHASRIQKFPAAARVYRVHCVITPLKEKIGTALLIPPQSKDVAKSGRYWIACLFTSASYGAEKDPPAEILENTRRALASLRDKVLDRPNDEDLVQRLYAVRINAGKFKVPWKDTRAVLEQSDLPIAVINNLAIMNLFVRTWVKESMEENGFSLDAPPPWEKGAPNTVECGGAEAGAGQEEQGGD